MESNDLTSVKNINYSETTKIFSQAQDFLPLLGTDYVEFYVGNAKQAAHYYKTAFGFQDLAYAGLETGVRDRTSYVLQQGKIRLVLTTPLTSANPIADHIKKHGDGVKVIALWVDDATDAFEQTVKRGAKPYLNPESIKISILNQSKIKMVKFADREFIPMVIQFIFLSREKITKASFFPDMKSINRTTTHHQQG